MANTNAVTWFEIYVDDMARARKFYETVLGKTMEEMEMPDGYDGQMVAFPWVEGAPNASGALVKDAHLKPSASGTIVYFATEDCGLELSRVEQAGGTIVTPKMSIGPYGFCGLVNDSEGNIIGFHSMK
jgi:predicted enzyme related to lactoylglutathione lyase